MPNITTLRNAVSTVQEATELLSTATQLGMPIPAPQGTHAYLYKLSYTPKELRKTVKDLQLHTTYETALQSLVEVAADIASLRGDSPWACTDFYNDVTPEQWKADMGGYTQRHAQAKAAARKEYLATHTPREIIETLLGPENQYWEIVQIRIRP